MTTSPTSHRNHNQDSQHGPQQDSGPGHRRDREIGGLDRAGMNTADIESDDWAHAPRARSTVYSWLVLACLGILAGALFCLGYALGHSAHAGAHAGAHDSGHAGAGPAVTYPVAAAGSVATHKQLHNAIHTTSHTATGASGGPVAVTTRPAPSRAVVATVRVLAQHTPLVDPSTPAPSTAKISVPARPAAAVAALTPTTSPATFATAAVGAPAQRPKGCKTGWMDDLMTTGHPDQDTRSRRNSVIKAGPIEIALGADPAADKGCDQNRDQRRADDRDCPCQPYGPGYRGDPYPGSYYPGDYQPRRDYRPDYRGGYPSDYDYPNGYDYPNRYPGGYRDGYRGGVCRTVGPRVRPELPHGGLVCTRSDPNRGW